MGPVTLFDFDGTLCNSLPAFSRILNRLAPVYKYKPFTEDMIPRLRGMSTLAIIRELEIPTLKIPAIIRACRAALKDEKLEIFPGIAEQLAMIPRKGVLSSNSQENIDRFLREQQIEMHWVYSGSSLLGKARMLKKFMRENRLHDVIYVGDEIRDIEAAHQVGIKIVSVAWGFHSAAALRAAGADHVVDQIEMLASVIARSAATKQA